MTRACVHPTFTLIASLRVAALAVALMSGLTLVSGHIAQAQTFAVVHSFTRGQDGANPWGGLAMDAAGNLYGTATTGGVADCLGGCGTVFKLAFKNSNWTLSPLYNFTGAPDGAYPEGRLIFGRDGRLYGTTGQGGAQPSECQSSGCGTVFALRPQAAFCQAVLCFWSEDVLYRFNGGDDGSRPTGDSVFDQAGNFFGTTFNSGASGVGTVYELSPSGGGWTESVIHSFSGSDGANPYAGLTQDSAGNLYGPTKIGGLYRPGGVVFELSNTQSGWTENILHNFNGTDGDEPLGGLVRDASGNIFGTTNHGGQGGGGGGQVFELTQSGGSWNLALLHGFNGTAGPWADLAMDSSGALYGTTVQDGAHGLGSIFKMTFSGGSWTYTTIHDFNGDDGANPHGNILIDANGNLYGTTVGGGAHSSGVVWEITP
jgi:uncharacterized repeat protein (TIGR03803 family)